MRILILGLMFTMTLGATSRPGVGGFVTDEAGEPLPGARVSVYYAWMRDGTSTYCPSCWADCGKSAVAGADGAFQINSLDPNLVFQFLVVAEGYQPAFVKRVDPLKGKEIHAKLKLRPAELDPSRVVRGRVLDSDGRPLAGAVVTPFGWKTTKERAWGTIDRVDPMSVTNVRGEWILVAAEPVVGIDVEAEARGLATTKFALLEPGATSHDLKLGRGATVTGRLVKDGVPVAGARVGLSQKDASIETETGHYEIGTDGEGRFTFVNVGPAGQYSMYGLMASLRERGATGAQTVKVPGNGETGDAGDLTVRQGYGVEGQLVLSDGKSVPPGTLLTISPSGAWDSQLIEVGKDGSFRVIGLPKGVVQLSVRPKGYHLSAKNRSLDPVNYFLMGLVDGDVAGLKVLMEPGEEPLADAEALRTFGETWQRLTTHRIEGAAE